MNQQQRVPQKPEDDGDAAATATNAPDQDLSLVELYEEEGRALRCRITNLNTQEAALGLFDPAKPAEDGCYTGNPSRFTHMRRAERRLCQARAICNTVRLG